MIKLHDTKSYLLEIFKSDNNYTLNKAQSIFSLFIGLSGLIDLSSFNVSPHRSHNIILVRNSQKFARITIELLIFELKSECSHCKMPNRKHVVVMVTLRLQFILVNLAKHMSTHILSILITLINLSTAP